MGQYYRVLEKEGNKRLVVYNRNIIIGGKEKYTSAKLMEHSWWYNEFVNDGNVGAKQDLVDPHALQQCVSPRGLHRLRHARLVRGGKSTAHGGNRGLHAHRQPRGHSTAPEP